MTKKEITWQTLVKEMKKPGESLKSAMKAAGNEWKKIKAGTHPSYTQGKSSPSTRKKKKEKKIKPGHKGAPSKTRPGKIDFRTHKGDKYYHRDGHLYDENVDGVKGHPYSHHKTKKKHHHHKSTNHEKIIKQLENIIEELKK